MAYISWVEDIRNEVIYTKEEIATLREKALQKWKEWPGSGRFPDIEDHLMCSFFSLNLDKELLELGEYIIKKYPDPEDNWYLASMVYQKFGQYFLYKRKQKEALNWYFKALDNGLTGTSLVWKDIAACYAELEDWPQADHWIEKCIESDKKRDSVGNIGWVDFADYFLATGRPERCLFLCQQVLEKHQYGPRDIWIVMANAYKALGDYPQAIDMLQAYVGKHPRDEEGYCHLALAVYEHEKDVPKVEALYLKGIELVKDDPEWRLWVSSVFHALAVVHLNENYWEKSFSYLNRYFEWKYPPAEYVYFKQLIDTMPNIENEDMATDFYYFLLDFEESPIRPGRPIEAEGVASDKPVEEIGNAPADISKLTDLDDVLAN